MTAAKKIPEKLYRFYRHECCWPYALSFPLVLVIYAIDFFGHEDPLRWPSIASYSIIAGYYLRNVRLYKNEALVSDDPGFFISLLTFKIVLWGVIMLGLLIL